MRNQIYKKGPNINIVINVVLLMLNNNNNNKFFSVLPSTFLSHQLGHKFEFASTRLVCLN